MNEKDSSFQNLSTFEKNQYWFTRSWWQTVDVTITVSVDLAIIKVCRQNSARLIHDDVMLLDKVGDISKWLLEYHFIAYMPNLADYWSIGWSCIGIINRGCWWNQEESAESGMRVSLPFSRSLVTLIEPNNPCIMKSETRKSNSRIFSRSLLASIDRCPSSTTESINAAAVAALVFSTASMHNHLLSTLVCFHKLRMLVMSTHHNESK
jgi:hypothetical protein